MADHFTINLLKIEMTDISLSRLGGKIAPLTSILSPGGEEDLFSLCLSRPICAY
jgi:hypothetical protein